MGVLKREKDLIAEIKRMPVSDLPKAKARLKKEINRLKSRLASTPSYRFMRINKIRRELSKREDMLQELSKLEDVFGGLIDTLDRIEEF